MSTRLMVAALTLTSLRAAALPSQAPDSAITSIEQMPEQLETRWALGEAEKAEILTREKTLLDDLCAHRDVLCLPNRR